MKARKSKLDQYADTLAAMDGEKKTLDAIRQWLAAEGCIVSKDTISRYLAARRESVFSQQLFGLIASGGRMNKELDAAFKENPAPHVERLNELTKTLVMSLQVRGVADPKLLNLANSMQQTVLQFISAQTKAAQKERELNVAEEKLALLKRKADQADQAKGLLENKQLSEAERASRMHELFGIT